MPILGWELPSGMKTLSVNGYDMAYMERGQGTPVVLIHGSLNDYRAWAFQMEPLSTHYRTIAVCLRHFYPEPWNGEDNDFSVHQHSEDLASFIKSIKAGPVHLVAHSRGGDVALILTKEHPQLVQSMVLADPAPFDGMLLETPEVRAEAEKRKVFVTAALERLQQGDVDSGLEIFIDAISVPGNWKKIPEAAKQIRRDNAWSLKSLVADAKEPYSCADAKKLKMPVLLLTADRSPSLYGMMHAALQPCLEHSRMITIPNASHGMNRENPEVFNTVVLEFLAENIAQRDAPDARNDGALL
jgi:pimeloyl-ACP methyl ester carboxylesterase